MMFVNLGVSIEDIDSGLSQGLEATYWDWARNQAFERHTHLNGLNTVLPCHADPKVLEPVNPPTDPPGMDVRWRRRTP